jgi:hypothetical protein
VKYCEIIADNLSKAGWTSGCVSAIDSEGRTIWIADAHGKRFVVHADEKLTAFMELEAAIRATSVKRSFLKFGLAIQFPPQGSHAEQSQTKQKNCRAAIGNTLYGIFGRQATGVAACFNRLGKGKRRSCG